MLYVSVRAEGALGGRRYDSEPFAYRRPQAFLPRHEIFFDTE